MTFASAKDWFSFVKEGKKPIIRESVLNSWERSENYLPDASGEPRTDNEKSEPEQLSENAPRNIIKAVIEKTFKGACGSKSAWIFCNPSGEIVETGSFNQQMRETLISLSIDLPLIMSEKYSGTNAVSLAMENNLPTICTGAEHYLKKFHILSGAAAPYYDVDGTLRGYIALIGLYPETDVFFLRSMILMMIQLLDREMRITRFKDLYKGVKKQFTRLFNDDLKPTVMVTRSGYIRQLNPAAMNMFGIQKSNIDEKGLDKLAVFNPPIKDIAQSAIACEGREMEIRSSSRDLRVVYDKIPIFSETDEFLGAIFIFHEKSERASQKKSVATEAKYTFRDIMGKTAGITMSRDLAQRVAGTSVNVLLFGPSGTGKEMFAQSIHNASPRKNFPFLAINCAAIPREIAESELFGYASGAFTGASKGGNIGKLEAADKGTVFLDEIGDMPIELQAKLLRLLEERTITRVGSSREIPVNIRIIAATNKDIQSLIEKGEFREDLYYRINVSTIKLPPLSECLEDIPELVNHFIEYFNEAMGKKVKGIDEKIMEKFKTYSWPGNIRELRNSIEFAVMLNTGEDIITLKDLPGQLRMSLLYREPPEVQLHDPLLQERQGLENSEKALYHKAVRMANGNLSEAAKILNIGRSTLYRKMKKFGMRI